ncbi:uncharacterized protein DNG_06387 [Cephalotrichum gorgonifer]|uniref:Uncharacterized protein n=1 Tax=Cephalotrichum gorgonifer TaxID=2041049 RepID=A0AAE8SWK0_9PEZI|nr:uncharacterized protein DNG_06387 [Cephalotrichum gorgonifer]
MADDPEATLNAALTLLKTTSASRAVAKRVSGVSGMELAVLRSPQPPRSTPAPQPPVPSIRVNVAVDMILLNPSWSLHADKNTPLNMDPVYYIGFPAPAMPRSRMRLRGDVKALVRIYNLRVVYAIVEPGELRAAAEVPWPENDVWEMAGWGGGVPATLEGFLSAYDDDRGPLGPFVCGGKEYFEIPSEEADVVEGG